MFVVINVHYFMQLISVNPSLMYVAWQAMQYTMSFVLSFVWHYHVLCFDFKTFENWCDITIPIVHMSTLIEINKFISLWN